MCCVSKSTLQRLPVYLTYLRSLPDNSASNISATSIAAALGLGEVQVRKDLALISGSGRPKTGYILKDLISDLEKYLGCRDIVYAVVVGSGKLGKALLDYDGFTKYGLNIAAGFDIDNSKEGMTETGKRIFNLSEFGSVCRRFNIKIGILTVPAASAQTVCDLMISNGIEAVLNFTPVNPVVPENIVLHNVNIAVSLAVLSNHLKEKSKNTEVLT
jgi:redox-sensing transcriptional repressor